MSERGIVGCVRTLLLARPTSRPTLPEDVNGQSWAPVERNARGIPRFSEEIRFHGHPWRDGWCRRRGSNSRPSVYKTAALPLCYAGPCAAVSGRCGEGKIGATAPCRFDSADRLPGPAVAAMAARAEPTPAADLPQPIPIRRCERLFIAFPAVPADGTHWWGWVS